MKDCVGLGEVGEDLGDVVGQVFARDLQRGFAKADGEKVLLTLGANLCHVGQRHGVEAAARALPVGLECGLVCHERAVGVAQTVMDRGDRVEQVAEVLEVGRRPVDLQSLQQAFEGLGVVACLMVDDADQVQGPHFDDRCRAPPRQVAGFEGEPERLVELPELVGHAGQAVERLGLALLVAVRTRQDPRLLHE